jgi:hypothetical protein
MNEIFVQVIQNNRRRPFGTIPEGFLCQGNMWAVGNNIIVAINFNFKGDIWH